VGALPGRIIQGLKQAGSNNPVFVLDEIDKLGSDFRGDPSAALLEVLDPEQNNAFRDHYLNVNFDLTNVMFLTTANTLDTIPAPLRDRMEIIQLPGYTQEEKVRIAKKYLIKKQILENGIQDKHIEWTDEGTQLLIDGYTREAGLRNLERLVGSVCRKTAKRVAEGNEEKVIVTKEVVMKFLGPPTFIKDDEQEKDEVGISTGLAWTQVGGEVLYVECTTMKGKGGFTLTGQLGDVMKESGHAAWGYIRSRADEFGIDDSIFEKQEIHVHIPQGGIPKDGPSAGITMATAMVSKLTGVPVRKNVAMTGEITLTGKVLPIGGLKEKALAAMRMGISTIIIPWNNQRDLEDIPEEFRTKLTFIPVKTFDEVLAHALTSSDVAHTGRGSGGKKAKVTKLKVRRKTGAGDKIAA
jgi:ATP-dependent Lon protease